MTHPNDTDHGDTRITPAPRGPIGRLFLDPERRPRSGFRLTAYLVIVLAAMAAADAAGAFSPAADLAARAAAAVAVIAVTWLFRRYVDRRPWPSIGLTGWRPRELAAGFAVGSVSLAGRVRRRHRCGLGSGGRQRDGRPRRDRGGRAGGRRAVHVRDERGHTGGRIPRLRPADPGRHLVAAVCGHRLQPAVRCAAPARRPRPGLRRGAGGRGRPDGRVFRADPAVHRRAVDRDRLPHRLELVDQRRGRWTPTPGPISATRSCTWSWTCPVSGSGPGGSSCSTCSTARRSSSAIGTSPTGAA